MKEHRYEICGALKDVQGAVNSTNAGTSFRFALGAGQEVFPAEVTFELQCEDREYGLMRPTMRG